VSADGGRAYTIATAAAAAVVDADAGTRPPQTGGGEQETRG